MKSVEAFTIFILKWKKAVPSSETHELMRLSALTRHSSFVTLPPLPNLSFFHAFWQFDILSMSPKMSLQGQKQQNSTEWEEVGHILLTNLFKVCIEWVFQEQLFSECLVRLPFREFILKNFSHSLWQWVCDSRFLTSTRVGSSCSVDC